MEPETAREDLKARLRKKIDERVEEILSQPLGTLEQMEEAAQRLQRDMARETLEGLIVLKKTLSRTDSDPVVPRVKGP
jgi:hypothetical protein